MKKFLAISLAIIMVLSLAACGKKDTEPKTDAEYVQKKGTLIVGITDFAPMDYQDAKGEWIGFDAEMAKLFAESLGIKAEFMEIEWDYKEMTLDAKTIDCIWNGMTLTDAVKEAMETSNAYADNAQVLIVKKDKADSIKSKDDLKGLNIVVENGSAGAEVLDDLGIAYMGNETQAGALMEVSAGTSDAAVIDILMAMAMTGEGTSYENLTYVLPLNSELYGVGFRKGSDLAAKLNEFFVKAYADGTMQKIADIYGIADSIVEQK